jgi:outer membrane lipoprotein-sorting protein
VRVGSRYRKFPVPGLSDTLDPIEKLSDLATSHANDFTVKDLGTSTVDGVAVHGFAVARANSARAAKSPSTIYVAADGTIHQITQHTRFGMITLTFSKFNAPMTIEAPAN